MARSPHGSFLSRHGDANSGRWPVLTREEFCMKSIATLTMNPRIDISYDVDRVIHTHKMRTRNERYDPGGGGINVARVFARLGGQARCFYLSGGPTGVALDGLLDQHRLVRMRVPIAETTRVA